MKTPSCFLPIATAALWLPAISQAQTTTALPGFISYQGRVLNSSGGLVGSGTPVNRTVTFRVWSHASDSAATSLLYSETQTVTISEGEFSVLVGQGIATTTNQFPFVESDKGPPAVSLADAFNGGSRFLAVTVDDGTTAADNEITPRQQIVSSAYAFRAKYAEMLGTSTRTALTALDSGNVGVGNPNPPGRFTITGPNTGSNSASPQLVITDSADTNERLRIGVDSGGNGTGFIQSFKEGTGAQNLLLNPNGGFVGVGKTNPATAFDVNGVIRSNGLTGIPQLGENGGAGQRLVLWPGSATTIPFGLGIEDSTLWQAVPVNNLHKWYEGNSEKMRLSRGNLGIGSTDPIARLTLGEAIGTPADRDSGTLLLDHENSGGASSIVFRSKVNRGGGDFGYLQYQDAATVGGAGEAAVLTLGISNDADDNIAIMPSGSVGVGTTRPTHKLQVAGLFSVRQPTISDGYVGMDPGNANQAGYIAWYKPGSPLATPNTLANRMGYMGWDRTNLQLQGENGANFFVGGGNMAVGTSDATRARLVVAGGPFESGMRGSYINANNVGNAVFHGGHVISIYADNTIMAGNSVIAASDERIKKIEGISDSEADLQSLLNIQVTNYHYKDAIGKGDIAQKKVIAQQLEKVFPQAVAKMTDTVPDIYKTAEMKAGWVELATDLQKGDRVKLISAHRAEIYNVLEVKKDRFRTDFDPKAEVGQGTKPFDGKLFVYGREVKDFRTVDYDAVSMLNVSATQALKKEMDAKVKALEEENALLKSRLTAFEKTEADRNTKVAGLEARDKALQTQMAAIEKLLQSQDKAVVLKTAR